MSKERPKKGPKEVPGLDDPTVIDMVMLSPEEDRIDLVMVHTGVWDRSAGQLLRLQEKWQYYVGFAIHGGLERMYPDYARLPWRIVLDTRVEPDERTKDFFVRAREETRKQGGDLVVRIVKKR